MHIRSVVVALFAALLVADSAYAKEYKTITEALEGEGLTQLLGGALAIPPFAAAAKDPKTKITLFAPINKGFEAIAPLIRSSGINVSDPAILALILRGHSISSGVYNSADVKKAIKSSPSKNVTLATDAPDVNLTLSFAYNKKILVTAVGDVAYVLKANIKAGDSIIHIVNHVLMPVAITPKYADLAAALPGENTTILLSLVKQVPSLLAAATQGSTNVTLFAPADAAFTALLPTIPSSVNISDPATLAYILGYHIVPSAVLTSTDAISAITVSPTKNVNLPTLANQSLSFSLTDNKGISITSAGSSALVTKANIMAGKSIVHIINNVLLPFSLLG